MSIWNKLFSEKRTGVPLSPTEGPRTNFQRDFDRIIFSSAFRRLQNKTQVFPLPGSVFVHNRLTHSLETASVGRSLGTLVGNAIYKKYKQQLSLKAQHFYRYDLSNVIASACLCHDIGNPPFGHSGEDAIARFFRDNESSLKSFFTEKQWLDFIHFEGNANAIRVLTHQQNGKAPGGLRLTYTTLASIAKYPCESAGKNKKFLHRKKFGFFQAEKEVFQAVAKATNLVKEQDNPLIYKRHPFVWLTEVADDICYHIIDWEDAHRLQILEHSEAESVLIELLKQADAKGFPAFEKNYKLITDKNAKIEYLRARVINALTLRAAEIYMENIEKIVVGKHTRSLFKSLKEEFPVLQIIAEISEEKIYDHRKALEIELAGYNVMSELLGHFIFPILKRELSLQDKMALKLLPASHYYKDKSPYEKVLGIVDYVSGMTDIYATELFKKIKGIELGMRY